MPVGGGFSSCGCGGAECASPTTPIATTGLCLPDGTPLAVIAERDCVGTVQQTGWLNLTTGAYTTGVPPTGAGACGDARSIQTAGVFCDLAADGVTVLGLVVVEYHYDDAGAIESVRLVSAATGATYVLQGTLTVCPGGEGDESPGEVPCARQVVTQELCDDADGDGSADTRYTELWSVDPCGLSAPVLVGTYRYGDFGTPYVPLAPIDCALVADDDTSPGEPETVCAPQVIERCGCDDPDGDGVGEVAYTELWAVSPCGEGAGTPVLLGTWQDGDFTQPYTPLAPVDCPVSVEESPADFEQCTTIVLCDPGPAGEQLAPDVTAGTLADGTGWTLTAGQPQGGGQPWFSDGPSGVPAFTFTTAVNVEFAVRMDAPDLCVVIPAPAEPVVLAPQCTWNAALRRLCWASGTPGDPAALSTFRTTEATDQLVFDTASSAVGVHHFGLVNILAAQDTPQTSFLRTVCHQPGGIITTVDTDLGGAPYTPTGAPGLCVGPLALDSEVLPLCDTATDGTVTAFLRRYTYTDGDPTPAVSDTALDGLTAYTVTGTVGACATDPCRNATTVLMCSTDTDAPGAPSITDTDPTPYFQFVGNAALPGGGQALWDGGSLVFPAEPGPAPGSPAQWHNTITAFLQAPVPVCDDGTSTATITATVTVENQGPTAGYVTDGAFQLQNATDHSVLASMRPAQNAPVGYAGTLTITATVPASMLAAGDVLVFMDLENWDNGTGSKAWLASDFSWSYELGLSSGCVPAFFRTVVTDCQGATVSVVDTDLDGDPITIPAGVPVADCASLSAGGDTSCLHCETAVLCDTTTPGGPVVTFQRTTCRTCTGGVVSVLDTELDSTTPYAVVGQVGLCGLDDEESPAEECRDSATVLLCDLGVGDPDPDVTVTDTAPDAYMSPPSPGNLAVAGAAALWAGNTFVFPAEATIPPGAVWAHRWAAATVQADAPGCTDGTATVTVSVDVTLDGPTQGNGSVGGFQLRNLATGAVIGADSPPASPAVGYSDTLTITAQVPAADLAAGQILVILQLEVNHSGPKSWTADNFTAVAVYGQEGCEPQFLRKVVTDCVTGETVNVTDTTLDGAPYTVSGNVGQCTAAMAPAVPEADTELLVLCDVGEDGTSTTFLRSLAYTSGVVQPVVTDTELDGTTPYAVTGTVGGCRAEEDCQGCESYTLCDTQPESPGDLVIDYEALDLASLPDGPTSGTLPNGVNWTVSCGQWLAPQGHYTIYPPAGAGSPACDMVWTFDQPVFVRFGLRGFNVGPRECMSYAAVPDVGFVVDSLHPNHRMGSTPSDSICGLGSATDQSVVHTGAAVTELTLAAITNGGAGRGIGLMEIGLPADPQPDPGTVFPFRRTVCRDCYGTITSLTDRTLDGEVYAVTGTVGLCDSPGSGSDEECRDVSSTLLCDVGALTTLTVLDTVNNQDDDGWQVTSYTNGGCATANPPDGVVPGPAVWSAPGYLGIRADRNLGSSPCAPWAGYDTAAVRWVLTKTFTAPEDGNAVVTAEGLIADGGTRIRVNGQDVGMYAQWNQPATGGSTQVPVTAGPNVVEIEVRDTAGPNYVRGVLDIVMNSTQQFLRKQVTDCDGAVVATTDTRLDGTPYTVTGTVGECEPVATCCESPAPELRVDIEGKLLCILDTDGTSVGQVWVERVYDDQRGELTETRLTDPTTGEAVTLPADTTLGACGDTAPCRNSSTLLVCDVPASTSTGVDADLADSTAAAAGAPAGWGNRNLAGSYAALWSGGTLNVPATAGPAADTTAVTGVLTAVVPAGCDAASGTLTVSVRITNQGPDRGQAWDGTLQLKNGATILQDAPFPSSALAGQTFVRTVSAPVTLADLASGALHVLLGFETYHLGAKAWTASEFSAVVDLEGCEATTATQILRTVVTDCVTGEVVSTSDATLDGEPYTVTGEVGECVPAESPAACCPTGQSLPLCDVADDGTVTAFLRRLTYTEGSLTPAVFDTGLDGVTPYMVAGTVDVCDGLTDGEESPGEEIPDTELLVLCDVAVDGASTGFLRHFAYADTTGVPTVRDTALDGVTPYAVAGTVGVCASPAAEEESPGEEVPSTQALVLCDLPADPDTDPVPFLRLYTITADGTVTTTDTALDGLTPYTVTGTPGVCPGALDGPLHLVEQCRCDDTDGDGVADTDYVELLAVAADGTLTSIGTYAEDFSAAYVPVAPVSCDTVGAPPSTGVQAHRVELAVGDTWSAATVAALQSVTMSAFDGTGEITSTDGTSTLHTGESVTWSVTREQDAALVGPLTITTLTGSVTVAWTAGGITL